MMTHSGNITVTRAGRDLRIVLPQEQGYDAWMSLAWFLILLLPTFGVYRDGGGFEAVVFLVPALVFGYASLAFFFNRVTIHLDDRLLSAGHPRLPVVGHHTTKLPAKNIRQLSVEHQETNRSGKRFYRLMVRYANGRERALVQHHADLAALRAAERTLEDFLDLRHDGHQRLTPAGKSRTELLAALREAETAVDELDKEIDAAGHRRITAQHKVLAAREALGAFDAAE